MNNSKLNQKTYKEVLLNELKKLEDERKELMRLVSEKTGVEQQGDKFIDAGYRRLKKLISEIPEMNNKIKKPMQGCEQLTKEEIMAKQSTSRE